MKILKIGNNYEGFVKACKQAGHEVLVLPYWQWFSTDHGNVYTGEFEQGGEGLDATTVNRRVLDAAEEFKPDLIIQFKGWMDANRLIWPETIINAKRISGCKTAYWSVDDPDFMPFWKSWHRKTGAEHWDIALTCCKASIEHYQQCGVMHPHYFLPAFDTTWPIDDPEAWANPPAGSPVVERDAVDLVLIGHPYWSKHGCDMGRALLAREALRAGMTIEIYGPDKTNWTTDSCKPGGKIPFLSGFPELEPFYRSFIPYDDVWRACLRGKVVLNNHLRKEASGYGPFYHGYVNDKVPLMPGTGSLMLMDHQPGMSPDVLTAGEEYLEYEPSLDPEVCLKSAFELLKLAVEDDNLRHRIREAGRARVLAQHTWQHRVAQLEEIVAEAS